MALLIQIATYGHINQPRRLYDNNLRNALMATFSTGTKVDKMDTNKKCLQARPSCQAAARAGGGGGNPKHAPGVQTERVVKRHKVIRAFLFNIVWGRGLYVLTI